LGWTFDDMIRTTRQQQRPYFKPQDLTASRQKARYSDTGFQLLIRILETVTGNSFDELLTERIFDPLSLTSTWLPRHRRLALEVEPSPLYTKQRRVDLTTMLESTNDLFSTNGDLLTFQRALLSGEIFRDPDTRNYLTERRNRLRNIPVLKEGWEPCFTRSIDSSQSSTNRLHLSDTPEAPGPGSSIVQNATSILGVPSIKPKVRRFLFYSWHGA